MAHSNRIGRRSLGWGRSWLVRLIQSSMKEHLESVAPQTMAIPFQFSMYIYIYIYVYFFYYILYTIYILIMYIICMYIYILIMYILCMYIYIYNRYIYIPILIYAWWFKHQTWWFFMGFSESIIHPCRMWRPAISWLINPIHYINIILYYITLYYIVYIRINMGYVHTIHPS